MKFVLNGMNVEYGVVDNSVKFQGKFNLESIEVEMTPEEYSDHIEARIAGQKLGFEFLDRIADKAILVASEMRKQRAAERSALD